MAEDEFVSFCLYTKSFFQEAEVVVKSGVVEPAQPTLSIAERDLLQNFARIGYATEGTLYISLQLPTDVVSVL